MCCHSYRAVTRVIVYVLSWLQGRNKSDSVCVCCHGYRAIITRMIVCVLSWLQGRNKSDSVCVVMVTGL